MGPSNIRDILTSFSPSLDFFAVTSGDGRIKIWDTVKGQLQTEFSNIASTDETNLFAKPEQRGHLSIDYTCMKWVAFDKKKKRKLRTSLLVLGTGSGDVLALDVSAGQLKWKISDCHPGGVNAISFSTQSTCIYTSGADGMVCEVDSITGNLLRKFRASTKAVSSICVSPDGKIIATAAAQMKIFNCSDHKKIQKFSGHPGAVRCMTLSEDGKYVFSSATGERYVAVWRADGSKKQSASCVLAMEHPSVYLDCRYIDNGEADGTGFYVLAISEIGVCYFWYGKDTAELRKTKPTKIALSVDDSYKTIHKGGSPAILAARIQSMAKPGSAHVFFAHGFLFKPSFEKIVVHRGEHLNLNISRDGLLLPLSQLHKTKKQLERRTRATALDRANAEGALLPVPKVLDHDGLNLDLAVSMDSKADVSDAGADSTACPMEDQLRSVGILSRVDSSAAKSMRDSIVLKGINLEASIPPKKMRALILSMAPDDAFKMLNVLIDMWQTRSCSGKNVLPWIYSILVHHGYQIMSMESETATIRSLQKIAKSYGSATESLLQLSGRLQLVTAQIDKATQLKTQPLLHNNAIIESEDEDDDVDEVLFGEEGFESESSKEDNDD